MTTVINVTTKWTVLLQAVHIAWTFLSQVLVRPLNMVPPLEWTLMLKCTLELLEYKWMTFFQLPFFFNLSADVKKHLKSSCPKLFQQPELFPLDFLSYTRFSSLILFTSTIVLYSSHVLPCDLLDPQVSLPSCSPFWVSASFHLDTCQFFRHILLSLFLAPQTRMTWSPYISNITIFKFQNQAPWLFFLTFRGQALPNTHLQCHIPITTLVQTLITLSW